MTLDLNCQKKKKTTEKKGKKQELIKCMKMQVNVRGASIAIQWARL